MKMLFTLFTVGLALTRQEYVDQINSIPGLTWKAGINERFKGKPLFHSKALCGVKGNMTAIFDDLVAQGKVVRPTLEELKEKYGEPPATFDSETNWPECAEVIGDIRDQSNCGCCWAFGAATAASDRLCISSKAKYKVPLSAQSTCFCASRNGCQGGQLFTPWEWMKREGVVTGGQYQGSGPFGKGMCTDFTLPHCHHHGPVGNDPYPAEGAPGCASQESAKCPKTCDAASTKTFADDKFSFKGTIQNLPAKEEAIRTAIAANGPVEVAFTVYGDFENYSSGIYKKTSNKVLGGHAVTLVGWGEEAGTKYWKVQNSWNPYWGEKGYFRIVRGTNECGIEDSATSSSGTAVWGPKKRIDAMDL